MIKLFTDNDLDGLGCNILINYFYNDNIDVMLSSEREINSQLHNFIEKREYEKYNLIYVTDLIVDNHICDLIVNHDLDKKFIIVDHHETSLNISDYKFTHINVGTDKRLESASSNLLRLLNNDLKLSTCVPDRVFIALTKFIEAVRMYDTWEFAHYNSSLNEMDNLAFELNILLSKLGYDVFKDTMIEFLNSSWYNPGACDLFMSKIIRSGIKELEDLFLESKSKIKIVTLQSGLRLGIVSVHNSMYGYILNRLCDEMPEIDLISTINSNKISLRTRRNDIDLLTLRNDFNNREILGQRVNAKILIDDDFWLNLFNTKKENDIYE